MSEDETRLYDCGGIPVELTLPREEINNHFYHGSDVFRNALRVMVYDGGTSLTTFMVDVVKKAK